MTTANKRRKANRKTKRANKFATPGTIKGESIVIKFAAAEDEATGDGYEIYTLLRATGDRVSIEVPRDVACEPAQLRRALNKKASLLPREKNKALPMIEAAVQRPPPENWLYVRHVGWRPDMKHLVTTNGVIGDNTYELKLKPPRSLTFAQKRPLKSNGLQSKWLDVARLARYSAISIFTLSISCAAPLIRWMGMPSFVVCVYSRSKIGKSAALLLASSFNGIGKEKELPNLNTTVAAFQETARNFSGLLVPANETALLNIGKKNLAEQLTELIYTFAEGVEKTRHSKSTYVAPEGGADWDGVLVITSENSLAELAEVAGIERKGGEQARAIDVPAHLTNATIFDTFPKDLPKQGRKSWARRRLRKIREGCEKHHGLMLEPYGQYLIAKGDQVKSETRALMDEFLAELDLRSASEATHHAALCCALIYAGGMHGIKAKVLPFRKKRLREAIFTCCRAALKIARNDTTLRQRGRKRILAKLNEAYPEGGPEITKAKGSLHRRKRDGEIRFTVSRSDFIKWFPNRTEAYAALLWLHEAGKLVTVEGAVPKLGKFAWAITWPKFKGKGKRRIVFRDPRKAKT